MKGIGVLCTLCRTLGMEFYVASIPRYRSTVFGTVLSWHD